MAEPNDSTVVLQDVDEIIRELYMKQYFEHGSGRFGRTTNRLFKMNTEIASGDGITMQAQRGFADSVRAGVDPIGSIASPTASEALKLKIRFNQQNPAASDFTFISASAQRTHWDIESAGDGAAVDIAMDVYNNLTANYDEHVALLRNLGRNAVVAFVNGTPKLQNALTYSEATGTATNAGGLLVTVDNAVIAGLREGQWVDFINPATGAVRAGNIYVDYFNRGDNSIQCSYRTQFGGRASTGDLATVADNDYIVLSGEYNAGMWSIGAWSSSAAAGESFLGGVDRTVAQYKSLNFLSTRRGATSTKITKSLFDDMAIAWSNIVENQDKIFAVQTDVSLSTALRNEIGEAAFVQQVSNSEQEKRNAVFGSHGLYYQHQSIGTIAVIGDPLCPGNQVRFIDPSTWLQMFYKVRGMRPLPGDVSGSWSRMQASAPNTGKGLIYRSEWAALQQDFCTNPGRNAVILNVTPN